ncbi:G-type lectin S-receptor-like serine/threonine-protein kinase RKS1 [Linum grandiflorum]
MIELLLFSFMVPFPLALSTLDQMYLAKETLLLLLQLLIISLHLCSSSSKDTLEPKQTLFDNGQVLVSNGETYSLGFFTPGNSTSHNRYLGIWYTHVSLQTVVWVANRDNPISNTTGSLSINDRQGSLVLRQANMMNGGATSTIWTTNISFTSGNSNMVKLLDSGNLVVLNLENRILWQSFDHPTDTIFPNMKFGVDHRRGLNRQLRSWKSPDDPASGDWYYEMDPNGLPQMILYKNRTKQWRIGPWNGIRWNGITGSSRVFDFSTSVLNDNQETTFTWDIQNPTANISRMYLDPSGFMKMATWHDDRWIEFATAPTDLCDRYGVCGPNGYCDPYAGELDCSCLPGFKPMVPSDWDLRESGGGCIKKRPDNNSNCGKKGEGFVRVENAKVPDTSEGKLDSSLNLEMCEEECLKNCSCSAYASANLTSGSGCIMLYEDLVDTRVYDGDGQDLYVRVDAIELVEYRKGREGRQTRKKKKLLAIILASVGVTMFWAVCVVYCLLKSKRNGNYSLLSNFLTAISMAQNQSLDDEDKDSNVPIFGVTEIFTATNNFSLDKKLGQGGFGSVYKGILLDGKEIAVKRLSQTSKQGVQEFKNEVRLVSKLQHKNLARLLGCCIHEDEKMLVYEYLPNKSLDLFIFDKIRSSLLDWKTRFDIIIGIARGLLYLHQDSRLKIIHRDLKPGNVLLDATMNPKISDFGMARLFGEDQMEANTIRVVGTYGYMSPEYAMKGLYSTKSDVFSFGVLTLEIVSGKRSNHPYLEDPSFSLIDHVWELWREGRETEISTIGTDDVYSKDQVRRCIQIGLLCVQETPADRPTMSNVVLMLSNTNTLPSPRKPSFILQRKHNSNLESSAAAAARLAVPNSLNQVSITTLKGR